MGDPAAHEQTPVPGQDRTPFLRRQADQGCIPHVVVPQGVEAEHAQAAGQCPEMRVGQEARLAQWCRAQAQQGAYVEGLKHGIDGDAVAVCRPGFQADGLPVSQDQLDLGMGYTAPLDEVPDRGSGLTGQGPVPGPPLRGQEVVQLGVEAQGDLGHGWAVCSMLYLDYAISSIRAAWVPASSPLQGVMSFW